MRDITGTQYYMEIKLNKGRKVEKEWTIGEELINVFNYILKLDKCSRKYNDSASSKILYLDSFEHNHKVMNLIFKSAKYNQVRNVVNTDTLESRGKLKGEKDGDEEKTHLLILIEGDNSCRCLIENNYYGVAIKRIESYINTKIGEYYNMIKKSRFYKIQTFIIPNQDFLTALNQLDSITSTSLIVDRKDFEGSDFLGISKLNDVREEVEVKLRRTKTKGIDTKTVKEYYNSTNGYIKRILVSGRSNNSPSPITLDTEKMKTKNLIKVETELVTDEVKSDSIFEKFRIILLGDEEVEE